MEQSNNAAKEGTVDESTANHVIELARKARLARRAAADFLRRWAVETAVENVGLVALSQGAIDLPLQRRSELAVESKRDS